MPLSRNNGWALGLLSVLCAIGLARPTTATAATTCSRPGGNTGTGFFVGCGRINNPDGSEYRVRGVVRTHYTVAAAASIVNTKANSVRTFYPYDTGTIGKFTADIQSLLAKGLTPVASMDSYGGTLTACRSDPSGLASQLNRWLHDAGGWMQLNGKGMIDLSSEWSPASPLAWRDQTIGAIKALRSAGFKMPVMIDSGTCSRQQPTFYNLAGEVAAADPQHNVVFWQRLDGNTGSSATMHTQLAALRALSTADPQLAFVAGVFGPGSNSTLTPDDMIQTSETNNLGWMAWTWDSNSQSGCVTDSNSNGLLANPCSGYSGQSAQLTSYGQDVLAQLSNAVTGGGGTTNPTGPTAPPEAVALGYTTNTFSVTNFNAPNTVDTTNSQTAGFQFYPYNLIGATPPLTDFQFNGDGSLTLLGANTGPNGELVSATPINNVAGQSKNKFFHGTAFGGGGVIEATLQFNTGIYTHSASGGFPSWWAQPLETAVIYGLAGSDQWPGQATSPNYHHSVENDFMEYLGTTDSKTGQMIAVMGGSLHESYGQSKVTCASGYCVYNSNLPLWTVPSNLNTTAHRYGYRWTMATATTPGKAEYLLDGVVQSSQSYAQFVGGSTQPPPPSASTPWAFGAIDTFHYVLILGTGPGAPMKVISVNVWQKDASGNKVN
jgi:hypothetical protein